MARIDYGFVDFHKPVFSRGKNFGEKVHANSQTGVKLWYDTELRFMCMEYKGQVSHFDTFHCGDVLQKDSSAKVSNVKTA